jgi:uncharacterized membrane protein YhaH (DUF805 family)
MFWRGYGRINRQTYFTGLVIVAALWAASVALQIKIPGEAIALVIAVPRLHDIGRSGWWAGGAIMIELVLMTAGIAFIATTNAETMASLAIIGLVIFYWAALIWLGCMHGQPNANQYGDPPPPSVSFGTYLKPKASTPGR